MASPRVSHIDGQWESTDFPGSIHEGMLTLNFTPNGELDNLSLECSANLASPGNVRDSEFDIFRTTYLSHVFGEDKGAKVTLFNAAGIGGTWSPLAYLTGSHLSRDKHRIKAISSIITNFEPWLSKCVMPQLYCDMDQLLLSASKSTVICKQMTDVGLVTLTSSTYYHSNDAPAFGSSLVPKLTLTLELVQLETLPRALELLSDASNLFTLLSGAPVRLAGATHLTLDSNESAYFYICRADMKHTTTNYPFTTFNDQVLALPGAIKRWFSMPDPLRDVIGKLAGFLMSEVPDYEDRFLKICRIAESFARLLDDHGHVTITRDGKRRNFVDCLKVLFEALLPQDYLSKIFVVEEPQVSLTNGSLLTEEGLDNFLANVLCTRDTLTHLVLDKPKTNGRLLVANEIRSAVATIAFATLSKVLQLVLEPLTPTQLEQLHRALAAAYVTKKQGTINQLFK